MDPITVVIADFDQVKRTACEYLLRYEEDIQVVGQAGAVKETIAAVVTLKPKVLICKFTLAAPGGFSLLQTLRQEGTNPATLLLTDRWMQEDKIMEALNAGARGHISVDAMVSQLAKAVRSVGRGEIWVPRQTLGKLLDQAAMV